MSNATSALKVGMFATVCLLLSDARRDYLSVWTSDYRNKSVIHKHVCYFSHKQSRPQYSFSKHLLPSGQRLQGRQTHDHSYAPLLLYQSDIISYKLKYW